ncbi:dipeptidase [Paenibacillus sp. S28]|uniref:dipeptidase n=1 Tax=Paenibacillus sp. S28 TaxID=2767463 RepID=UPI00190B76CA|nr:membrane dipeptidase [Paenibacillus sp. S28]MBJ9990291.1 membrane dipeptidase [Paenibacillus sp. S28]
MTIPVVDYHCDVLSKMVKDSSISFADDPKLDVTYKRLQEGEVALQTFAIFLSEERGIPRFEHILDQIDVFTSRVVPVQEGVRWMKWREDAASLEHAMKAAEQLPLQSHALQPWGLLSVEGADGFEGNLFYVKVCYDLGVRFLGITWNHANWAADGVMEKRKGGFTEKGKQLIELCNETGLLLDVSHLSEAGFWELAERSKRPFIASHSNAKAVCPHPRNLNDEQIRAIAAMDGRIGITFVPYFVKEGTGPVVPADVLPHIERMCEQGAGNMLMFGSDFDGIETWIQDLEHPGRYPAFIDLLLARYPEDLVKGWMSGNALSFLSRHLPAKPV